MCSNQNHHNFISTYPRFSKISRLLKVSSKGAREKIEMKTSEALEQGQFLSIDDKVFIASRDEETQKPESSEFHLL